MKRNICLIGMIGSGKTSVGAILAERLEWGFVDMDETVEAVYQQTLEEIHSIYGENTIREMETKILLELTQGNHQVIACSDGIIREPRNLSLMNATGMIFCLEAPVKVLSQRIGNSKYQFMLQNDPQKTLQSWLEERKDLYRQSDFFLSTEGYEPSEVAKAVHKLAFDSGQIQF